MLGLFRRAAARTTKQARLANLRASAKLSQSVSAPGKKNGAPKPVAAKAATAKQIPRTPPRVDKPRAGLAETIRAIKASALLSVAPSPPVRATVPRGASFRTAVFSCDHGERAYKLYIPAKSRAVDARTARMPLLVMLHGCSQTPDDFAAGTRMNALAEEFGLLVAYPAQTRRAHGNRCWNWYQRGDQRRGAGEPAVIAGLTRAILRDHRVDPARVYVAGLSAGGSAAAIVAAAYPDIFAAVGIHSGLPVGAAHDAASAIFAMRHGAPGDRPTVAVPTILFHGDADTVVNPSNGRYAVARALVGFPSFR